MFVIQSKTVLSLYLTNPKAISAFGFLFAIQILNDFYNLVSRRSDLLCSIGEEFL